MIARPSNVRPRGRSAFTLVELLVVITIIGMLMALLLPAVNQSIEAARSAQCKSTLRQLATACKVFEAGNQRYPGYDDRVGGNRVSWLVAIMPQMERQDIYDRYSSGSAVTPEIDFLICPTNPPEVSGQPINSYAANAGYEPTGAANEKPANGVFHNFFDHRIRTTDEYISSNDGTPYTLLLSERLKAKNWNVTGKTSSTFVWNPSSQRKINETPNSSLPRPSSYHTGGGVNVAFADTHTQFLRESIAYRVYMQLMTPFGMESDMPAADKNVPLSASDYR